MSYGENFPWCQFPACQLSHVVSTYTAGSLLIGSLIKLSSIRPFLWQKTVDTVLVGI